MSALISYTLQVRPYRHAELRARQGSHPKAKLKSEADAGVVLVGEDVRLTDLPVEAWAYRLGKRSAITLVLDEPKDKAQRDSTVRAKFNTYGFADHKEDMIKLLAGVITMSLETREITKAMRRLS